MVKSRLIETWQLAAKDLNLTIEAPFLITLPSRKEVYAELLVKDFGSPNGMIIVKKFETVAQHVKEITDMGYGFSVLDEPRTDEIYNRNEFIDLLNEWGWKGDPMKKPL